MNKLLFSLTVRRSQADSNARPSAITPIPKPKGKFNIKNAMGLSGDHTLFTELQAVIHALALEAKIDFDSPWKGQEPGKVAKILRVSEERHSYLCAARFPRHWATSSILQRYINSVRSYKSGRRRIITSPPPEEENEQMDVDSVGGSNLQARDDRSGECTCQTSEYFFQSVPRWAQFVSPTRNVGR
ncbi:hypothetical protein C8R43DRAFT_1013379 [Mycena crocata]|nr:hypothetical protein C8R43DRAFT_1013379 [Mycena crocata]